MCSGDNPEHARFCLACGAPIAQDVTGSTGARKVVTVLFVDVAESTSLGERLDPESVRAILGRFFELARATVERHGGLSRGSQATP